MKIGQANHKFEIQRNEVHLWHCRFDLNRDRIEAFKQILSQDEREKASRFKFEIHKQQSIISRGVLRTLLGKYLKKNPSDLRFNCNEFNKPLLNDNSRLQFNVSHSGNRAIFGFVKHAEIGVDIEKIKNDFDVVEIAQHFFSADEIRYLKELRDEHKVLGFYRCWTRKESFIKAKGIGLSFSLTSFSVSLDADRPKLLRTEWDSCEKEEWKLFSFEPAPGYLGALSVQGNVTAVQHMDWDFVNR